MQVGSDYVPFLEKITDMFEAIAHELPQYQQLHDSCRHQFQRRQDDRLTSLMSYVYADIIQFCLELYCMFSKGPQGMLDFTYKESFHLKQFVIPRVKNPAGITENGHACNWPLIFVCGVGVDPAYYYITFCCSESHNSLRCFLLLRRQSTESGLR